MLALLINWGAPNLSLYIMILLVNSSRLTNACESLRYSSCVSHLATKGVREVYSVTRGGVGSRKAPRAAIVPTKARELDATIALRMLRLFCYVIRVGAVTISSRHGVYERPTNMLKKWARFVLFFAALDQSRFNLRHCRYRMLVQLLTEDFQCRRKKLKNWVQQWSHRWTLAVQSADNELKQFRFYTNDQIYSLIEKL